MRAFALLLLVVGLAPQQVLAQDAPAEAPAAVEAPPAPAPVAPAAPPAAAPPPAAQPPSSAPTYAAPTYAAPTYAAPTYAPPAPPPQTFAPQQSPLVQQPAPAPYYTQPAPYYQLPPPSWAPRYPSQNEGNYVLPPLPPGYVYMPTPAQGAQPTAPAQVAGASREQLYAELLRLDARATQLEQQRISVGGPIVLMVLGYGTGVVAGLTGLASFAAAENIQHRDYDPVDDRDDLDINDDGRINGRDAHLWRRAARISAGVAAGGLILGIVGTRRLVERREQRKQRAMELKGLAQKRAVLRSQLGMAPEFGPGHVGFSLQSKF